MSRQKTVIWVVAGCAAVVLACFTVAAIALALGGGFLWSSVRDPEDVVVDVEVPVIVARGEPFFLEVQVENTAAEGQSLHSIDVTMDYLAGIAIRGADPSFVDSFDFAAVGVDWRSYTFRQDIAAGDTLVVRFESVGLTTGDYSGTIDVCINVGSRCLSFPCRTIVED